MSLQPRKDSSVSDTDRNEALLQDLDNDTAGWPVETRQDPNELELEQPSLTPGRALQQSSGTDIYLSKSSVAASKKNKKFLVLMPGVLSFSRADRKKPASRASTAASSDDAATNKTSNSGIQPDVWARLEDIQSPNPRLVATMPSSSAAETDSTQQLQFQGRHVATKSKFLVLTVQTSKGNKKQQQQAPTGTVLCKSIFNSCLVFGHSQLVKQGPGSKAADTAAEDRTSLDSLDISSRTNTSRTSSGSSSDDDLHSNLRSNIQLLDHYGGSSRTIDGGGGDGKSPVANGGSFLKPPPSAARIAARSNDRKGKEEIVELDDSSQSSASDKADVFSDDDEDDEFQHTLSSRDKKKGSEGAKNRPRRQSAKKVQYAALLETSSDANASESEEEEDEEAKAVSKKASKPTKPRAKPARSAATQIRPSRNSVVRDDKKNKTSAALLETSSSSSDANTSESEEEDEESAVASKKAAKTTKRNAKSAGSTATQRRPARSSVVLDVEKNKKTADVTKVSQSEKQNDEDVSKGSSTNITSKTKKQVDSSDTDDEVVAVPPPTKRKRTDRVGMDSLAATGAKEVESNVVSKVTEKKQGEKQSAETKPAPSSSVPAATTKTSQSVAKQEERVRRPSSVERANKKEKSNMPPSSISTEAGGIGDAAASTPNLASSKSKTDVPVPDKMQSASGNGAVPVATAGSLSSPSRRRRKRSSPDRNSSSKKKKRQENVISLVDDNDFSFLKG